MGTFYDSRYQNSWQIIKLDSRLTGPADWIILLYNNIENIQTFVKKNLTLNLFWMDDMWAVMLVSNQ